jgi:CDGSH-type Zn-finger protein
MADFDITFELFSGGVFIAWLSNTSAYVALHHRDQASLVQKTLTHSDTYIVMTYTEHQQLQEERTLCKCAHSSGKSLCSSCIKKKTVTKQLLPFSPTTSFLRKRQLMEDPQEEPEVQASTQKRKRISSFGE